MKKTYLNICFYIILINLILSNVETIRSEQNSDRYLNYETQKVKFSLLNNSKFSEYDPNTRIFKSKPEYISAYDKNSKKFASLKYKNISFRIYAPDSKYRTSFQTPLIVFYHGSSAHGNDNILPISGSIKKTSSKKFQKKYPSYVIVPQCPQKKSWTHQTLREVISLISDVQAAIPNIDRKRKYLMGHSLGSYGVCYTLKKYPKYFTAAIPMAGAISRGYSEKHTIPITVVYNSKEVSIIKDSSKILVNTFRQLGSEAHLKKFRFGTHSDTLRYSLNDDNLMQWVFSK